MNCYTVVTSLLVALCCLLEGSTTSAAETRIRQPNIIFVGVKGMGWSDFGFYDAKIETPYLNRMYRLGLRVKQSYVDPDPSSTMADILTGNFSYTMGLQDGALSQATTAHVPTKYKLLPETLRGYKRYFIGEWNQGSCDQRLRPRARGFHYSFASMTKNTDPGSFRQDGKWDLFENERRVSQDDLKSSDTYLPKLFFKKAGAMIKKHYKRQMKVEKNKNRKPFFMMLTQSIPGGNAGSIPENYIAKCKNNSKDDEGYFESQNRINRCGMMVAIDKGMSQLMKKLKSVKYQSKTLFIFTSLSGGNVQEGGMNWPYRGSEGTLWEGGIHVPTVLYGKGKKTLSVRDFDYNKPFHAVDWFQTIYGFSRQTKRMFKKNGPTDGKNFFKIFKNGLTQSRRKSCSYIVNEHAGQDCAYLRKDKYKLIYREMGYNDWFNINETLAMTATRKSMKKGDYHLYNLRKDPAEHVDLAMNSKYDSIKTSMISEMESLKSRYQAKQAQPAPPGDDGKWGLETCPSGSPSVAPS